MDSKRVVCLLALFYISTVVFAQSNVAPPQPSSLGALHLGMSEGIGNFSLELLYYTSKAVGANFIISPFTVWTTMTVISEGATNETLRQLRSVLRISGKARKNHEDFSKLFKYLVVNTSTVQLENVNTIFADVTHPVSKTYKDLVKNIYQTQVIPVNFRESVKTASLINEYISKVTHGKIPKLVNSGDFGETQMILTNALYFKGQWTSPFNASATKPMPFYDEQNRQIGVVNMMYNRFMYPFASIRELQARVIELPYGKENRLSMLVMLPDQNVSLTDMYHNFINVPLDTIFAELKLAVEEYGEDEVDCYLPRFKIDTDIFMNQPLSVMGITRVFDEHQAQLQLLSDSPVFVSRVIHKATIEVTEEGTVAAAADAAQFANRISVIRFEANRPFAYSIIEKSTNAIVFGGVYIKPSLY